MKLKLGKESRKEVVSIIVGGALLAALLGVVGVRHVIMPLIQAKNGTAIEPLNFQMTEAIIYAIILLGSLGAMLPDRAKDLAQIILKLFGKNGSS